MGRGWVGTWTRTCLSSSATSYTAFAPVSPRCPATIHWKGKKQMFVARMSTAEKLRIIFLPGHIISLLQSCVISFNPRQGLPPWAAGGLVHERERIWVPPPQVTLHSFQSPHVVQPPFTAKKNKSLKRFCVEQKTLNHVSLPGQNTSLLQSCVISFRPTQGLPPWAAGGLVHERERVWVPPPHDTLHLLQFPQVVQPPSTVG